MMKLERPFPERNSLDTKRQESKLGKRVFLSLVGLRCEEKSMNLIGCRLNECRSRVDGVKESVINRERLEIRKNQSEMDG